MTSILDSISVWVSHNIAFIVSGLLAATVVALISFVVVIVNLRRMGRRYATLVRGMQGRNLEELLMGHVENVQRAVGRVNELDTEMRLISKTLQGCLQRVGVVRFNAFTDAGGDLSFAIALLDEKNNGLMLSSIYGREESRTYAKPILGGQSTYHLSNEEQTALGQAMAQEKLR